MENNENKCDNLTKIDTTFGWIRTVGAAISAVGVFGGFVIKIIRKKP